MSVHKRMRLTLKLLSWNSLTNSLTYKLTSRLVHVTVCCSGRSWRRNFDVKDNMSVSDSCRAVNETIFSTIPPFISLASVIDSTNPSKSTKTKRHISLFLKMSKRSESQPSMLSRTESVYFHYLHQLTHQLWEMPIPMCLREVVGTQTSTHREKSIPSRNRRIESFLTKCSPTFSPLEKTSDRSELFSCFHTFFTYVGL